MSSREFIALGTSSQVPTRERSHNAYMLRWDDEGFLFDPGEGAQRQLILAGIAACSIHHICITHFHGDHCLGLPGILQRLSVDQCDHPIHLYYPESGQIYAERLLGGVIYKSPLEVQLHPVREALSEALVLFSSDKYALKSFMLDHSAPAIGYRLEEPPRLRFLAEKLALLGVQGPMVGELQRKGFLAVNDRIIRIEEATATSQGSIFSFVMDTRPCAGAVELAQDADLLVMEATYASEHRDLADLHFHSTAADAAKTALDAGAHRLALSHYSQRYSDTSQHIKEAQEVFTNVVALNDLDRLAIPRRI
ncbi:MAG: ribonuclease Z [Acidobacteria bacterium]|nr:ribonuclease Z [Acidobacteriota bacterium]